MDLDGKKVFVAGATGMAGSAIARRLLDACPGVLVRGTRNRTEPFLTAPNLEYVQADLTRREDCEAALAGCDVAVLAAANTGGAAANLGDPAGQVTDNVVMDALLFQAMAKAGVKRAVFVSSATVYQECVGAIREEQLDLNLEPHPAHQGIAWAKRTSERLARFWRDKYGLEIVVVRAANIFGPYACFDPFRANFIPALARKAVEGMDPFEVWGSPDVTRDVIYADDFAEAVRALLVADNLPWGVFNVGAGSPVSVGQVVRWVLECSGHEPAGIVYSETAPTSVAHRVLDCSAIASAVGWTSAVPIRDGIARTIAWWRENRNWWRK